jgi:hypothetical protein
MTSKRPGRTEAEVPIELDTPIATTIKPGLGELDELLHSAASRNAGWPGEMAAPGAEEPRCRLPSWRRALPQPDNLSHAVVPGQRGPSQLEGVARARRRAALGIAGVACRASASGAIALTSGGRAYRAIAMATPLQSSDAAPSARSKQSCTAAHDGARYWADAEVRCGRRGRMLSV